MKKEETPRPTALTKEPHKLKFNHEISVDVFEVKDAGGSRHSILSIVDLASKFQVACRVASGGVPTSQACAEAYNQSWLSWAGAPKIMVADQGVHNKGKFSALVTSHGTVIRQVGVAAPHQLGIGERQGGLLKRMMIRAIHSHQLIGGTAIAALCSECAKVKNNLLNNGGYSPSQWVMGHTPEDLSSMMSHDPEENLEVHQNIINAEGEPPQEQFMMQLLLRQAAKEAYVYADSSQRLRKAMLRKSVPMRGPYLVGNMVSFLRRDRWYGPARVIGHEGKSSLWLLHHGVAVLVAETSCRPATAEEIYKKQVLELKPSRKRRRQIVSDDPDDDVYVPFTDDLQGAFKEEGQAPFVDMSTDVHQEPLTVGVAANPPSSEPGSLAEEFNGTTMLPIPPGLEIESPGPVPTTPLDEPIPMSSPTEIEVNPVGSEQLNLEGPEPMPHPEAALPDPSDPEQLPEQDEEGDQVMSQPTQLTQALRGSPDRLDGFSPHQNSRANFAEEIQSKRFAFLASRQNKQVKKYRKKTVKTGAGREINYEKADQDMKTKLDATRSKEWSNWQKYTDGYWVDAKGLDRLKKEHPDLRVIPTRWVDVNKAEPHETEKLKSRLVVRGDLEDFTGMRTDSPTCSQLMISLTLALSACRDSTLWSGDISAAFLQGSKLDRVLVLSMPRGGIPGQPDGRFFVVSNTVYGTKDAPRGWFKNLHGTMMKEGFRPIPHEQAAYTLQSPDGSLAGIVIAHVDDLMWTGGSYVEEKMKQVCSHYNFGKLEQDNFRYCGRDIKRDSHHIHVTCSSLIDRVRPIYLTSEQKKHRADRVPDHVKGQLRSVIGSLAWLARVCRPDLAYAISKLQSAVHEATFDDVIFANSIVSLARRTKDEGISYPIGVFKFEDAMVVALQDASHASDFDVSKSGKKLGFRSQSGRLLCLAPKTFDGSLKGNLLILEWHSTTIRRVCRSTVQAETLSLLQGAEEADHLRFVLHGLTHLHGRSQSEWLAEAQDRISVLWITDCKSVEQHVNQPGMSSVADKRLAIDLCGLRQSVWRQLGEEYGDPLILDHLPSDRTTKLIWTSTDRMIADSLTKSMKPGPLLDAMHGHVMDLTPTKHNGCENGGISGHETLALELDHMT